MSIKKKLNVLDLFSGIGGFSLGLESAGPFRTVAFCERDQFCQAVLRKHWPDVPIFDDVRTIPTDGLGRVDIIVGGFPCQPWSQAGKQRGAEDDRDLWPAMARLIEKLQPQWVICENVRGFIKQSMGLERSLSDLESIGYQAVSFVIPACAVDAPHRRDRVWIIAHANIEGEPDGTVDERARSEELVANSNGRRRDTQPLPSAISARRQNHNDAHQSSARRSERIVGDTTGQRYERRSDVKGKRAAGKQIKQSSVWRKPSGSNEIVADACDARLQRREQRQTFGESERASRPAAECGQDGWRNRWAAEPDVGRVAHGIPNRVDRLKALGNAVVPQIVGQIGRAILSAERGE